MTDSVRETVYLVPHTHWDREWYEPFQRFRLRLVDLLDDVLARAEADPRFCFTLDGQVVAVDDYLEVRPEQTELVITLVKRGQLAVGPWRILADEFLCSGETLVRNLEAGLARAATLGGAMPVGYLPDQFGHCAQMPQLLAAAGLRQACLWRGVPAEVTTHAFRWEAPDGTAVRCEYLPGGYGNAVYLLADAGALPKRAADFVARARSWYGDDPVLAMFGTDHSAPLPTLLERVEALEAADGPVRLELRTLTDYFALLGTGTDGLPTVVGELRSHARANILPGVLSARVHLKRAMAAAERMVERYAEPWAALWSPDWPDRFLAMAWDRLIASSCHDSVTGCGVDDTALQVAARIAEAEHLGQAVRDRVLARIAADVPTDAAVVVNPTPERRHGLVELDVHLATDVAQAAVTLPDGSAVPTQEIARCGGVLFSGVFPAERLRQAIVRRSFGQDMFGRAIQRWARDGRTVTFEVGRHGDELFDIEAAADAIDAVVLPSGGEWTLQIVEEPRRRLLADVPVPPLGWTTVRAEAQVPPAPTWPVTVAGSTLDNGLVRVTVAADGTLRIASRDGVVLDGAARLVDGGDAGDTYNYAPPTVDTVLDTPERVEVVTAETGPLRGTLEITRVYHWPVGLDGDHSRRSDEVVETVASATVELRAGEPFVRLALTLDNRSDDHRVRLHVPLAEAVTSSFAEGQFAVVQRGLTAEAGNGEEPIPTFPAYGWVDAGEVAVLLDHATEYELVNEGRELALTLVRAVGHISRNVHHYREEPAGPELATPLAQCRGPVTTRLALFPHVGDRESAGVCAQAERFRHDLVVAPGTGEADGTLSEATGLKVSGATMTSLRRRGDWLELRVVALGDRPTEAVISPASVARTVDLLGQPQGDLPVTDGTLRLPLRPFQIATVQLMR